MLITLSLPVYTLLHSEFKGDVNFARVDVPSSRELGTRFAVKGTALTYALLLLQS